MAEKEEERKIIEDNANMPLKVKHQKIMELRTRQALIKAETEANKSPITTTTTTNSAPTTTTTSLRNFLQNTPSVRVESTITERKLIPQKVVDVTKLQERYNQLKQLPIYRASDINPALIPKPTYESTLYDKGQLEAKARDRAKDVVYRINQLTTDYNEAKAEQIELMKEVKSYKDRMELLQEQNEILEALNESNKNKIAILESEKDAIAKEAKMVGFKDIKKVSEMQQTIADQNIKLESQELEIQRLNGIIAKMQTNIDALTGINTKLNTDLYNVSTMLDDIFNQTR